MTPPGNSARGGADLLHAVHAAAGLALLAAILLWSRLAAGDAYGDALIRNTVRLSLAWYAAALLSMMQLDRRDWACATNRGRLARWCWTWGTVAFVVHLVMAYHYFHGWSHAHAVEHTRQRSGWGEGIYVSFLFTWLWLADALWWWRQPQSYSTRPAALHYALHAFMLFIVFNGTVVFETGPIRWAGAIGFGLLAIVWLAHRARTRLLPAT